jgi:DNA-directed RNA polymerase sigma subunit (sigma70/sigma32)
MREMEALSWRYGLKQQEEQEEIEVEQHHQQQLQLQQIQTRDYLAEAEDDLFGVGGILNTPTATAAVTNNEANVAIKRTMPSTAATRSATVTASAAAMRSVTSINTSAFDKPQVKVSVKKQQQKQQPSKGGRWGEAMSFSEVGEQMRVSAEYGRRLCSSALKKLTKAVEEGQLDPAMLF